MDIGLSSRIREVARRKRCIGEKLDAPESGQLLRMPVIGSAVSLLECEHSIVTIRDRRFDVSILILLSSVVARDRVNRRCCPFPSEWPTRRDP